MSVGFCEAFSRVSRRRFFCEIFSLVKLNRWSRYQSALISWRTSIDHQMGSETNGQGDDSIGRVGLPLVGKTEAPAK